MTDPVIGLIVRCDDTGLGNQTFEIWRHLKPVVTVVVDMSSHDRHMKQHPGRFPGAIVTRWEGPRKPFISAMAKSLLGQCDVIISCETWYDPDISRMSNTSILIINPELYGREHADVFWTPTVWRISSTPNGTLTVPHPVALDIPWRIGKGLLHVAGKAAAADRNGTEAAILAAARARVPLTVTTQSRLLTSTLKITVITNVETYPDLYGHGDVLIMPRRYGGLSLPVQEAMAAGLAVIMPDINPNLETWPIYPIVATAAGKLVVPGGTVRCYNTDPRGLQEALVTMNDWKSEYQGRSVAWAAENSWDALLPLWEERISEATARVR